MNRHFVQRTLRAAARIAAITALTLTPWAATTAHAVADPAVAAPIGDTHFGNDDSHTFGGDRSGDHGVGWNDGEFGWDDNGHYGYRDHHRQDYDGWNDQFNSGHTDRGNRDSHTSYGGHRGSDYDAPVDWDREDHSGSTRNQTWNVPNPHIPPPPPPLLPTPAVHFPTLPHLPLPLVGLPALPDTGSAL